MCVRYYALFVLFLFRIRRYNALARMDVLKISWAALKRHMCMLFINYYDVKGKGFKRGINRSYKGLLMAVNVRVDLWYSLWA